jgi:hypothetical protein
MILENVPANKKLVALRTLPPRWINLRSRQIRKRLAEIHFLGVIPLHVRVELVIRFEAEDGLVARFDPALEGHLMVVYVAIALVGAAIPFLKVEAGEFRAAEGVVVVEGGVLLVGGVLAEGFEEGAVSFEGFAEFGDADLVPGFEVAALGRADVVPDSDEVFVEGVVLEELAVRRAWLGGVHFREAVAVEVDESFEFMCDFVHLRGVVTVGGHDGSVEELVLPLY